MCIHLIQLLAVCIKASLTTLIISSDEQNYSKSIQSEKIFLREHKLWKAVKINLEAKYGIHNSFDERIWGNYLGRFPKPASTNSLLSVNSDAMRKMMSQSWKLLTDDNNGTKKCFFVCGSSTSYYGEESLHTGVLVAVNKSDAITYFYFESMSKKNDGERRHLCPDEFRSRPEKSSTVRALAHYPWDTKK